MMIRFMSFDSRTGLNGPGLRGFPRYGDAGSTGWKEWLKDMSWSELACREDFIVDGCSDCDASVVDCIVSDPCKMRELLPLPGTAVESVSSSDIDCCFFLMISFSSLEVYNP